MYIFKCLCLIFMYCTEQQMCFFFFSSSSLSLGIVICFCISIYVYLSFVFCVLSVITTICSFLLLFSSVKCSQHQFLMAISEVWKYLMLFLSYRRHWSVSLCLQTCVFRRITLLNRALVQRVNSVGDLGENLWLVSLIPRYLYINQKSKCLAVGKFIF